MGTLRQSGIITQSTAFPYTVQRFGIPHKITNQAGYAVWSKIDAYFDVTHPITYARLDDGGAFTNYDAAAEDVAAGDVPLLPAVEVANDAFYVGSDTRFDFIMFQISQAGIGATIAWEYWNGAWVALTCVDNTTGLTAAAGWHDVTFTPPTDWASTTVNATAGYWIRLRCTAANFTQQPIASRILPGGPLYSTIETDLLCDGTETKAVIGTYRTQACGKYQLYINGVLDTATEYDDYAAVNAAGTRVITLTQPIKKGWNRVGLYISDKNVAATTYVLLIYGIAVY